MDKAAIMPVEEGKTLQYWKDARNGNKREYIYDYSKARTCNHPRLRELVQGANWYRCEECNYALFIMTAYEQPLHSVVLEGVLNAMHFSKEFGIGALQEVLRTPIGQYDGREQKPVLPEGQDLTDTLLMLEEINVTTPDGGERQLRAMQSGDWTHRGFLSSGEPRCLVGRKRHHYGNKAKCMWCKDPKPLAEGVNGSHRESLPSGRGDS